jgi:hypothetical protein
MKACNECRKFTEFLITNFILSKAIFLHRLSFATCCNRRLLLSGGALNMKTNGAHLSLINFKAEILLIKSIDLSLAMITFVTLNPNFHQTRLYGFLTAFDTAAKAQYSRNTFQIDLSILNRILSKYF